MAEEIVKCNEHQQEGQMWQQGKPFFDSDSTGDRLMDKRKQSLFVSTEAVGRVHQPNPQPFTSGFQTLNSDSKMIFFAEKRCSSRPGVTPLLLRFGFKIIH